MLTCYCRHLVMTTAIALIFGTQTQTAISQEPTSQLDSGVSDLVEKINTLEAEVRYLRKRQDSVLTRLPVTNASLQNNDGGFAGDAEAGSEFGSCQKPSSGKSCGCSCGCFPCLCPPPPAPCIDCPHVSTVNPYFNVNVFGALKLDLLFNSKRPISPGTPFFLAPAPLGDINENTVDMHARQSTLGAVFTGPQIGSFQSGGMIMATFYNDAVIVDQYGFLPLQAYGELRNDYWRFAAGLQFDVFSPGAPTVLPFSVLGASGNAGNSFRGQIRLERFIQPSDASQWTLQFAISEPIASSIDPEFRVLEDNGWPNIEGRIALALGCIDTATGLRPFELGISGLGGQIRTSDPPVDQVIADVWGLGLDFRWRINDTFGFAGEVFTGETLGTYNGGILQNVNTDTLEGIRASGGWIETFVYWSPCLHSHFGYGLDDPKDEDVSPLGRLKNETYYANLLWDLNQTFRIGCEYTWRATDYDTLRDNEGSGFHTQFQWSF
jgi:hypothetical protein